MSLYPLNYEVVEESKYELCYVDANTKLTLLHVELVLHESKATIKHHCCYIITASTDVLFHYQSNLTTTLDQACSLHEVFW